MDERAICGGFPGTRPIPSLILIFVVFELLKSLHTEQCIKPSPSPNTDRKAEPPLCSGGVPYRPWRSPVRGSWTTWPALQKRECLFFYSAHRYICSNTNMVNVGIPGCSMMLKCDHTRHSHLSIMTQGKIANFYSCFEQPRCHAVA